MTVIRARWIGIVAAIACLSTASHAAEPNAFRAGAGDKDITPPAGIPMWGYGARHDMLSEGTLDPLMAKAVVIATGDDKVAIVGIDLGRGPTGAMMKIIRREVAEKAGIKHVLITGSHTHHGPVIELTDEPGLGKGKFDAAVAYSQELPSLLVDAILSADRNLKAAKIGVGSRSVPLNRNRQSKREPKPTDSTLAVIRLDDTEGKPIAVIVNFAAHPVMTDAKVLKYSADYPGFLKNKVEAELATKCVFMQGAAGDMSTNVGSGPPGPKGFGETLAGHVIELARETKTEEPASPAVKGAIETFHFGTRVDLNNPLVVGLFERNFFPEITQNFVKEFAKGMNVELSTVLLNGEIALVGAPGEFFCNHANRLKARSYVKHTLFFGYCNGHAMYFPTIEAAYEGGYGADAGVSLAELGSGERMMDIALLTIYRLQGRLASERRSDGTGSGAGGLRKVHVRIVRGDAPAAARVSVIGSDKKAYSPAGAAVRKTKRDESYFYADGRFDVELPAGRSRLNFSGGIETIPQTVLLEADGDVELTVPIQRWVDMAARGWYSGDSHIHLHTGGPIAVSPADALTAARAEGVNYLNLCVSNNVGDDIRDAELITGKPHAASTDRHLLVFGEEMRSTIYGHMQFFGINRLVEPQYTGFDGTPNQLDFPANHIMATEAVRQGGVVTYGHPMFAGQSFPFEKDLAKPTGAARELPIDAVLGVVHAVDLMSYNSDEDRSAELWYRLLNCGLKLSASVGTDALLDRSTEPLGGERVYVKTAGPLTMQSWLDGLKSGRSFVTNGPIPTLVVNGKGLGETLELSAPGKVHVAATVESHVPVNTVELIVNGKVVAHEEVGADAGEGVQTRHFNVDVPIDRSSWLALRVRGPEHPDVFDGPAWAHTSPIYVQVAGKPIASAEDAAFFVDWIDQLLRVVAARNRYARPEDREQVETLFRKAQAEYRNRMEPR